MRISDLLSMCFRSLFRRKVRTLLTVMGVVIGTCSIVVMISLGVGLNEMQEASINEMMDLTVIEVYTSGDTSSTGDTLKLDDNMIKTIADIENVTAVTPVLELYSEAKITAGKYQFGGTLMGIDMETMELFGYELLEGNFIEESGTESKILFGEQAANSFYDPTASDDSGYFYADEDGNLPDPPFDPMKTRIAMTPINQTAEAAAMSTASDTAVTGGSTGEEAASDDGSSSVSTATGKTYSFQTAGIIKGDYSKDYGTSFYGIYIDIDMAKQLQKEYNTLNGIKSSSSYNNAKVKVSDVDYVEEVETLIQEQGFETYSAASIRESLQQMTKVIQLVLGGIGAISLLVAALGITNTMVMSIYERTKEIGVMKVLGCRLRDIRGLFLTEAGIIGLLGGIFGIILSYMISFIINLIASAIMASQGAEISGHISVIPLWLVLMGTGIAILVALVAGFYPANRAMRISALAAIRQE